MCDLAWIYFDTDGDPETGGFATSKLPGFEYEARVVSSLENGKPSTFYALDKFEQGETSFDMLDRYSEKGRESLQARQTEWNKSKSQITLKELHRDDSVSVRDYRGGQRQDDSGPHARVSPGSLGRAVLSGRYAQAQMTVTYRLWCMNHANLGSVSRM